MDKKIELSIFGAVAVILFIACIMALASSDNKGPVIKFDNNEQLTYIEGQDDSVLLAGVTAIDDKDGDVTDTLIVASKITLADNQTLKVTYAAKDSHNNVTKTERIVVYVASENGGQNGNGEPNTGDTPNGQENTGNTENINGQETTSDVNTSSPVDTGPTGEIDKEAANASGIPVIKLRATEATITVGEDFNEISYVKETYDDSGDVSRRIRVIGDYDIKKPGDYQLNYSVSDTDGNVSEPVAFTLHVLPGTEDNKVNNEGTNQGEQNEEDENQNQEEGQNEEGSESEE